MGSFFNRLTDLLLLKRHTGAPTLAYSSDGRSGYVFYKSKEASFSMYYEFGGGDCVASINIPGEDEWRTATGQPLERRSEILDFIGRQIVQDQTTNGRGYFKIEGNFINIYV